ncbi:MAG: PolC-type DNA polymerase III [Clostridiales bacterium]|nr:PolC-type DNA polymerase III [Clostridiales bacterium]
MDYSSDFNGCILKKTKVFVRERRWEIVIESPRLIDSTILKKAEILLKNKAGCLDDLRIVVQYPSDKEWFYKNFHLVWANIQKDLHKDLPSCTKWFSKSSSQVKGHKVQVLFSNPIAPKFLESKSVDKYIENWISNNYSIICKVQFLLDKAGLAMQQEEYSTKKSREDSSLAVNTLNVLVQGYNSKSNENSGNEDRTLIFGKPFRGEPLIPMDQINEDKGKVIVKGKIFDIEIKKTRNGKIIYNLDITDYQGSVSAMVFCDKSRADRIEQFAGKGDWVLLRGDCVFDRYKKDVVIRISDLMRIPPEERQDDEPVKRIELHLHTQMSAMDGVSSVDSLIERAARWGHPAIAITDHGVLQAFPDAYLSGKKHGIKVIYGVEAYIINDCKPLVLNGNNRDFSQPIVTLDIETTGLNSRRDTITEIGAVKIVNKKIVDSFQTFVDPQISIPPNITELTGITDRMVENAPKIEEALENLRAFCGDAVLAAHNAPFDFGFIRNKAKNIGWKIGNPIIDTHTLSRELIHNLKRYRLDRVADHYGIKLDNHHRALDDARVTGLILIELLGALENRGISSLIEINTAFTLTSNLDSLPIYHATILVKNQTGLRNLYRLVSKAHIDFFYRRPRIPKSLLMEHRDGLFLGSGCNVGELYRGLLEGSTHSEIKEIIDFYDFLEVQPPENCRYLVDENKVNDIDQIEKIVRSIVRLGKRFNKPVVATGDVHFLDPQDEYFRRILMAGQGFKDSDRQPPLYLKTTKEMLEDFKFLDPEISKDIVINTPRLIAESIQDVRPIPDGLFTPKIPGAEEMIREMAIEKAKRIYGNPLPDILEKRLDKELFSIIEHGFAVLYLIAHKLVTNSTEAGYLVGSRGSVGSSIAAFMTEITEVNPLPPHYICPVCQHSDFAIDKVKYGVGIDLPPKKCQKCGADLLRDGFDIPFEVFLGFKGDKIPDIDLNFSGDYQHIAHKYIEDLFGEEHVFRAGTIGTIAQKTAFGFVKKYLEDKEIIVSDAEIKRLVTGCTGIKRTTGQHPGGIMVVPEDKEIFEFTPIQYPADAKDSGVITTHFDYNFIHDNLIKLDILGHDDPTMIRMLEDLTGVDAKDIPLDDPDTMAIFSGTESLGIKPEDIGSQVGTFGIPEFGTRFVRQMLNDTKPTTFSELIRISGLSHGTDVWINNAKDLIRDKTAQLSEVISTRDDIMIYLIYKGLEPTLAFKIMEDVRRGKGLTPTLESTMAEKGVPDWFITSCKKIKYMFPKAHAAAYVIMSFRIAFFKVHYPHAFYAAYFTIKADDFDADYLFVEKEGIVEHIKKLESKGNKASQKEKGLLTILEVTLEMYSRSIYFLPIDLYKSHPTKFLVVENSIRPPLYSLQGVGINAALSIGQAREEGEFISVDDLRERTRVTKTVIEILKKHDVLDGIPETCQLSLF